MLDANQYRAAAQNLGIDILDKGYNTNFIKEMQQTGYTQNHRLSFSNGNDDSNYRASIGVIDQKGIIKIIQCVTIPLRLMLCKICSIIS